jgi:hypothetical protein
MKVLSIALGAALAACGAHSASKPAPLAPPQPILGTTHHATADAKITGPTTLSTARALLDATDKLVASPPNRSHAAIDDALFRLADALAVVSPDQHVADLRVREAARELKQSTEDSTAHADLVRAALQAAASALRAAPIPGGFDETSMRSLRLREAADAVENAANSLDPSQPLMDQYATVRIGLRESTRAVYAALDQPEPAIDVHATASR